MFVSYTAVAPDASIAAKTKANGTGNAPEVPNEAAGAPPADPSAAPVVEPSGQVTKHVR